MHALMRIVVLSTALALPLAGHAHAQGDAAPQTPWGCLLYTSDAADE